MINYVKKIILRLFSYYNLRLFKNSELPDERFFWSKSTLGYKNRELVIFDVGAHYGESLDFYRSIFPRALIYSFEPDKISYEILKNIHTNEKLVYDFGFSDQIGSKLFYRNIGDYTNSIYPLSKDVQNLWDLHSALVPLEISEAMFDTIDNFCIESSIFSIDLLKIDVQGSELSVLKGANNMLSKGLIKFLKVEFIVERSYENQASFGEIMDYILGFDYKLVCIVEQFYNSKAELLQFDGIFKLVRIIES